MTTARRWTLLATVSAGLLLITLDNSILYTALPILTEELGTSTSESLWIINAYPLVMAGLLLSSGTLGDRVGHRRMLTWGLVVFGTASLMAAYAPNPVLLIAARALLAVGAASMMPATLALLRVTFDDERERNLAVSVWGSMAVVGSALGPIVGGILLEHFYWGSVFLINIPVVIAALVAVAIIAPTNEADRSKRWDLLSSIQATVGLAGLVFVVEEVTKLSPSWIVVVIALVTSLLGLGSFVRRQRILTYPLLDFSIFRNSALVSGVLAAAMATFTIGGIQLVTTQRFQLVAGFTPLEAGLLVAAIAVGSFPTTLIGGAILHRVGLLPLISGGLAIGLVGVIVAIVGLQVGLGWMIAGFVITGAGLGAAMSVASTAIIGNVQARRAGMASSVNEVSYEFGSLTAVAILGALLTGMYTATLRLPEGTPDAARESFNQALSLANQNNAAGAQLITAASSAFDTGYIVVMTVISGALACGAVLTAILLRHHGAGTPSQTPETLIPDSQKNHPAL